MKNIFRREEAAPKPVAQGPVIEVSAQEIQTDLSRRADAALDQAIATLMANYKDAYTSFFSAYSHSSITEHAPTTPELPHV